MLHTISKKFDFCYGHRVWSQTLNAEYSEDTCLKCRHLHGHQGEIEVFLRPDLTESSDKLINGMITDFKHLGWFKKWIDNVLDHKFIMDINDPLINYEIYPFLSTKSLFTAHPEGYKTINLQGRDHDLTVPLVEKFEGMIFVDFIPTSENLSRWLAEIIDNKMAPIGVRCYGVKFNETPKSQSQVILHPFT